MCSPLHFKRIEFKKIGTFSIEENKLRTEFPGMKSGTYAAVNDISIANRLDTHPYFKLHFLAFPEEPKSILASNPALRDIKRILK